MELFKAIIAAEQHQGGFILNDERALHLKWSEIYFFEKRLVRNALVKAHSRCWSEGARTNMKMSAGQTGRLGLAVAGHLLLAGRTALAEGVGQPGPWKFDLQASATPVMDDIMRVHNWLLV